VATTPIVNGIPYVGEPRCEALRLAAVLPAAAGIIGEAHLRTKEHLADLARRSYRVASS
jgi:hypothetical protein